MLQNDDSHRVVQVRSLVQIFSRDSLDAGGELFLKTSPTDDGQVLGREQARRQQAARGPAMLAPVIWEAFLAQYSIWNLLVGGVLLHSRK